MIILCFFRYAIDEIIGSITGQFTFVSTANLGPFLFIDNFEYIHIPIGLKRAYDASFDIVDGIAKNGLIRELDRFELEPEESFEKAGAKVCVIDIQDNEYFKGDISDKETLEAFAEKVISDYGHVDYLINNAPPLFIGIDECSYEDFSRSLAIGVTAAFYLTKLFKPHFGIYFL